MRAVILLASCALAACNAHPRDSEAARLIADHSGACHIVPGVRGATGRVGPSLDGIGRQQVIAGYFPNNRANMIRWMSHAQQMLPGNAMPDTGLTADQAATVADYLYTLD